MLAGVGGNTWIRLTVPPSGAVRLKNGGRISDGPGTASSGRGISGTTVLPGQLAGPTSGWIRQLLASITGHPRFPVNTRLPLL